MCKDIYRGVEQLVARRAHNPEVRGSSPLSATKKMTKSKLVIFFFVFGVKQKAKTPGAQIAVKEYYDAPSAVEF